MDVDGGDGRALTVHSCSRGARVLEANGGHTHAGGGNGGGNCTTLQRGGGTHVTVATLAESGVAAVLGRTAGQVANQEPKRRRVRVSRLEVAAAAPIPTQAHIEQAPHVTVTHRIWRCPALDSERAHFAPPKWAARQADGSTDHLALERALVKPAGIVVPPKCDRDTFHWVVEPPNGVVEGVVYPDGLGQDGRDARVARLGWAFVAVDAAGAITAVARGLPPPWIDDVPGTEAWAVLQAAARAAAPLQYRIDCQPCVQAIHNGRKWATAAHRTHARVHGLLHEAVATTPEANFVWMLAHTRPDEVGKVLKGNGVPITNIDWMGNDQADAHAKLAVEAHRVPLVVRKRLADWDREVMQLARWVGLATHLANHLPEYPYRDSVASRAMAQAAKLRRRGRWRTELGAGGRRWSSNAHPPSAATI